MKKFLKIFLITLASLLLIVVIAGGIATWLIFTPKKLTPIVTRQAARYINCQSEIGEVELTFFSTFPQFGLKTRQLTLINPVPGTPNDTLLHVKEIIGIINMKALIRDNELIVNNFILSDGNACIFIDNNGNTNFDIFDGAASEPDTTQTDLIFKIIDVENVELKNMNVLYVDQSMNMKADVRRLSANINGTMKTDDIVGKLDIQPFDLSLEYRHDASSVLKTEIRNFSTKIAGSMKAGVVSATVGVNPFDLALHYDSDSLKFDTNIRSLAVSVSGTTDDDNFSGKIRLFPCHVTLELDNEKYLHDALLELNLSADAVLSRQFVRLKEAYLSVNDLKLDFAGTVENDTVRKQVATDLSYKFDSWQVKSIMSLIPPTFASYIEGIEAAGILSSEGTVNGVYSESSMPMMDVRILYEKGTLRYADFPVPLTAIHADVNVRTDLKDPQSFVRINRLDARTPQSSVKTAGRLTRLFSDIHANLNTDAELVLSEFASLIPDSLKITANGKIAGKIKSEFSMSQITNMQLEKIKASGAITLSDLDVVYDSLTVKTDRSTVEFALPNLKESSEKTKFVFADISANHLEASKINNFQASLQQVNISFESSDFRDTLRIPDIFCSFQIGALSAEMDSIHLSVAQPKGNLTVAPRKNSLEHPEIKLIYNSNRIKAGYGQYSALVEKLILDVEAENKPEQKDILLQWEPKGFIEMEKGVMTMTALSYPVEIPGIKMKFDPETFIIEEGHAKLDKSDFNLSGTLTNVSSYIRGDSLLVGNFDFISHTTDVLQIMDITSGIGYDEAEKEAAAQSGPYLVPKGMSILLHTDIGYASYGDATSASKIKGDLRVHDGTLYFEDISFATPAGDTRVTAEYRTTRPNQRRNHLYLGLALHLLDIEIGELLRMIPAVDTIMPMLRSFGGKGDFHFAGDVWVDSMYNVKPSTIRAAASISGTDMVLMDSEMFSSIAKSLRFDKKTENKVDSLSAEFTILGEEIHVHPFLIVMDRYKAVVGGRHYLDMTFDYNISVVQSPLPFRLSVDVRGTPERPRFGVGRSKYPDFYRPAARRAVESREAELRRVIREGLRVRN